MKYYVIAGEASGDLHASNLLKEIRQRDPDARFRAWGGDLMQAQGAEIVKHYRDLAFMGFVEVAMNLHTILGNMRFCKKDIKDYQADVLILVDYPGFNLPIAKFAHALGIKVVYYISPQVWAWKKGRVKTIRKAVDKMLVILPFEKAFYNDFNIDVEFVGHPLLDAISSIPADDNFLQANNLDHRPIIALLPGSRKQEITAMLKGMLSVIDHFAEYQFVIAAAPAAERALYERIIGDKNVKIVQNQTYALLAHATAALVTSGTATLETALFNVPEVVCYKANQISYEIAKRIVDIKYISLVNLIMDKEVVKELIQHDFNEQRLVNELNAVLKDETGRTDVLNDYNLLKEKLGGVGASARAARIVVDFTAQK